MRLAARYVARHMGLYLATVFFLVAEALFDLLQPTLMSYAVDEGVQAGDLAAVLRYGFGMLGAAAASFLAALARNALSARGSQVIGAEMRSDVYRRVMGLSPGNVDRIGAPSIVTRLTNDVGVVVEFVTSLMRAAVKAPVLCVGAVVLIALQTPEFVPLLLAVVAAVAAVVALNVRLGAPRFTRMQRAMDGLNDASREFLSSVRVVKAFGAEAQTYAVFEAAAGEVARAGARAQRLPAVLTPFTSLSVNLGVVALLWLSQSQDASQIGRLMASVNYMTQLILSLGLVGLVVNRAVRASASGARLAEILAEEPELREPGTGSEGGTEPSAAEAATDSPSRPAAPGGRGEGSLAFEGVSFSYGGAAAPALRDVSFEVPDGAALGVIGPTGSGKTTLVNLVARMYDACEGRVLVGGRRVASIPHGELCRLVSVVPQVSTLFTGTVGENLRWGDASASEAELWDALRAAGADGFVGLLPGGLGARVDQGGTNLSGGQRQRLCIARAVLRRPRVLLLDDCTSSLDASTEAEVLASLGSRLRGTTVVLVSQRVSTVRRADEILVLEGGRAAGFGAHAALLGSCPAYRAIYESQTGDVPPAVDATAAVAPAAVAPVSAPVAPHPLPGGRHD